MGQSRKELVEIGHEPNGSGAAGRRRAQHHRRLRRRKLGGDRRRRATDKCTSIFRRRAPGSLACGGTHLVAAGGAISSETVWNDGDQGASGGGVSRIFPTPRVATDCQGVGRFRTDRTRRARRRGQCQPASGFRLYVARKQSGAGGTSAATPLWAGLVALLNQGCGRNLGNINPILYGKIGPAGVLRSVSAADCRRRNRQTRCRRAPAGKRLPAGEVPTGSS